MRYRQACQLFNLLILVIFFQPFLFLPIS